ncbi:hypothetical protein LOTGIDRAFT_161979 [Lottia gigantea]|uniref:Uncharacterized protein n=1 Tax=Lottia gigantea TaxID=225164 RepID=V4A9J7_LOTGI|nr:hypothetical protein LOTGIDRAFT_161979 [Lottia gigantea]ESO93407.1 hypothetical protein LOTGIDRAFT_161979 [Lottia gigantea]
MTAYGRVSDLLPNFILNNNLYDIWRRKNPDKREFTRQQVFKAIAEKLCGWGVKPVSPISRRSFEFNGRRKFDGTRCSKQGHGKRSCEAIFCKRCRRYDWQCDCVVAESTLFDDEIVIENYEKVSIGASSCDSGGNGDNSVNGDNHDGNGDKSGGNGDNSGGNGDNSDGNGDNSDKNGDNSNGNGDNSDMIDGNSYKNDGNSENNVGNFDSNSGKSNIKSDNIFNKTLENVVANICNLYVT